MRTTRPFGATLNGFWCRQYYRMGNVFPHFYMCFLLMRARCALHSLCRRGASQALRSNVRH
ncbi:unnamed protein product [Prunus brigantina]